MSALHYYYYYYYYYCYLCELDDLIIIVIIIIIIIIITIIFIIIIDLMMKITGRIIFKTTFRCPRDTIIRSKYNIQQIRRILMFKFKFLVPRGLVKSLAFIKSL